MIAILNNVCFDDSLDINKNVKAKKRKFCWTSNSNYELHHNLNEHQVNKIKVDQFLHYCSNLKSRVSAFEPSGPFGWSLSFVSVA